MLYLIIYDISVNSVRTKVAKALISQGFERLQLSVFLGLTNPKKNITFWKQLTKLLIDDKFSKFYVFPIPKNSLKNMFAIGNSDLDIKYLIGDKNSMLF